MKQKPKPHAENFHLKEFLCKCGECQMDDDTFENIELLAIALQKFRYVIAGCLKKSTPIIINSGYRCKKYNEYIYKKLGLKPNQESMHILGLAADIRKIEDIEPVEMAELAELVPDFQRGGIGVYDWGLHLDIRWMEGKRKARWDGQ